MNKSRYQQIWDGVWEPLPKDWDHACCGCGLVHRIRIRIRNGRPEMCFTVDKRKTAGVRRGMKVKVVSADAKKTEETGRSS